MYFDHFGIGMGCSAMQITYSTENLSDARWVYDQFHCITSFFAAATACSPIMGGRLMDWDCRLRLLEQSVDDRNPREQKGLKYSKYSPA